HFGSESLGNLDRERPDAAGSAVDQHPLRSLYPSLSKTLKRRAAGGRQARSFLEGQVRRLQRQRFLRRRREFRIRTEAASGEFPEDFIAGMESGDAPADRFDAAGDVGADNLEPGPA